MYAYLGQHVETRERQQQHSAIGGRMNETHQRVDEVVGLHECVRHARLEQKGDPRLRYIYIERNKHEYKCHNGEESTVGE